MGNNIEANRVFSGYNKWKKELKKQLVNCFEFPPEKIFVYIEHSDKGVTLEQEFFFKHQEKFYINLDHLLEDEEFSTNDYDRATEIYAVLESNILLLPNIFRASFPNLNSVPYHIQIVCSADPAIREFRRYEKVDYQPFVSDRDFDIWGTSKNYKQWFYEVRNDLLYGDDDD